MVIENERLILREFTFEYYYDLFVADNKLKSPFSYLMAVNSLAEKYTNCAHYKGKEARDSMIVKWMLRLFTSKDYRLGDVVGVLKASFTMGKVQKNVGQPSFRGYTADDGESDHVGSVSPRGG